MKKLSWAGVAVLAVAAFGTGAAFVGCGSEDDNAAIDGGGDGAGDGTVDGTTDLDGTTAVDSGSTDAPGDVNQGDGAAGDGSTTCSVVGSSCSKSGECCTANCSADGGTGAGKCAPPNGLCKVPGLACFAGNECCTGSCVNNTCSNKVCVQDTPTCGACTINEDCCSNICEPNPAGGNRCRPVNGTCNGTVSTATCRTSGNSCATGADCCSKFCNNGTCSSAVSFCTQETEICSTNVECCTGSCVKQAGNITGACGAPAGTGSGDCKTTGTVCATTVDGGGTGACDQSCCSKSCGPFGGANSFKVCQPASGCRPTGEICQGDIDCCGSAASGTILGIPVTGAVTCNKGTLADGGTTPFGKCSNNPSCNEPGALCKTGGDTSCSVSNNCCEPPNMPSGTNCNNSPELCCRLDALFIPRCSVTGTLNCDGGVPAAGTKCATSADCCGNPCINFMCGAASSCVTKGNACTTTADCCTGLPCVAPPGSTSGICGGSILADGGLSDASTPIPDAGPDAPPPVDAGNCALYGQLCVGAGDCCSGVPCTGGRCRFP
jgi:hypothetical protein